MSDYFFDDLEARRADLERTKENSARLAHAYGRFTSTGQGSITFPRRLAFGLTFTEEPFMSACSMADPDDIEDLLDRRDAPFPIITPFVAEWDRDDRGFWVGVWCGVRVWWPPSDLVPASAKPEITHSFTFSGIAMKDVPIEMED